MKEVKKAVIPVAGLATRFLPLSKELSKEMWPLGDKPLVQHLIEELAASGIFQVIFVFNPESKQALSYFKRNLKLENLLEKRKKDQALAELRNLDELQKKFSFSYVIQRRPLGDGHAILQAREKIGKEPFVVLYCDDIVFSQVSATAQLLKIFKTCQRPVVALTRVPEESIPLYGIVEVEKIASRLFKLKKIVEKPSAEKAPSDLAIVGKYVLTSEIFDYFKKQKTGQKGEIWTSLALDTILSDGKIIYGYELEGKWLECGNKLDWLKSQLYFSLNHPQHGEELKKYLKQIT